MPRIENQSRYRCGVHRTGAGVSCELPFRTPGTEVVITAELSTGWRVIYAAAAAAASTEITTRPKVETRKPEITTRGGMYGDYGGSARCYDPNCRCASVWTFVDVNVQFRARVAMRFATDDLPFFCNSRWVRFVVVVIVIVGLEWQPSSSSNATNGKRPPPPGTLVVLHVLLRNSPAHFFSRFYRSVVIDCLLIRVFRSRRPVAMLANPPYGAYSNPMHSYVLLAFSKHSDVL